MRLIMSISIKLASISLITCLTTFSVIAKDFSNNWQASLKFGGWSHHSDDDFHGQKFNESHNGLGLQVSRKIQDSHWSIGAEYFYMRDSYSQPSQMTSILASYSVHFDNDILTQADIVTGLTHHNRSRAVAHWLVYPDGKKTLQYTDIDDMNAIYPSLMLTTRWYDFLEVDVTLIPKTSATPSSVVFFRLGIPFTI